MHLYSAIALATLLSPMSSLALEFKFRPSYLELHDEGIVQRVMPGELVEVPMGESSSLEIETSPVPPREVKIKSKGECEFIIFGAGAKLQDGGMMTASMDQQTRKLDISWTRGEMKTPPQDFDKPAAVAFFTSPEEEMLRPLDFAGVRPFGYTDELEGRKPWTEKTLAELPPLGLPPPTHQEDFEGPPQDWISFEDDSSAPEPLSIPAPIPPKKKRETPSQLVFLEPSSATSSTPPYSEDAEDPPSKTEKLSDSKTDNSSPEGKKSEVPRQEKPKPEASAIPAEGEGSNDSKASKSSDKKEAVSKGAQDPEENHSDLDNVNKDKEEGEKPSMRKAKPTLYEIVMEQERRQEEVLKMIADVSNQVKILKERPLTNQPAPPVGNEEKKEPLSASEPPLLASTEPQPILPSALNNPSPAPATNAPIPSGLIIAGSKKPNPEGVLAPPEPPSSAPATSVDFEVEVVTDDSITVGGGE
jgi:hypothetical protein